MKGVLLVNLGSPDSPEKKDVKKYLKEFLMDERVIDEPLWLRTILVKGIILNFRPKGLKSRSFNQNGLSPIDSSLIMKTFTWMFT